MSIREIYQIFAEELAKIDNSCGPGCATCCTRSVTLTSGEGKLILDYLAERGRELPPLPFDVRPLRPGLTANSLAKMYLSGREPQEEGEPSWLFEPCFFLDDGLCIIYEVRPFACRSMVSTVACAKTGQASAPDWLVTLAIVFNQVLEELDPDGCWGNLADVLAFLSGRAEADYIASGRLLVNRPVPGFLLLPDERERIRSMLDKLSWRELI